MRYLLYSNYKHKTRRINDDDRKKIRARRKQLGMSVDDLAAKLGKNRATIYRYENDMIEMPASLLKPLAEILDTTPGELMDWGDIMVSEIEHQEKMCELLPQIRDGLSIEGERQKYLLFKVPAVGGRLEIDFHSLLLTLYQINQSGQASKMRTVRILGELVSSLDARSQEHLISYAEFLDARHQKQYGTSVTHPYQYE